MSIVGNLQQSLEEKEKGMEKEIQDFVLESPSEKKARIISLFIAHISMFLSGFSNAIILIGMFPYIQALEPEVSLFEYGIVVAADAAAQMVFSPVFGLIIDK